MSDDGPGTREVAYRPFAAEFDDATLSYSESDEERAPNYVVTPTGARINRLFAVGVLTEVERVNDETRRGRIVDPSGAFVTYAGQYQPDAQTFLERAAPPAFVALTGKARTFEPEDSDRVFTSVRPESLNEVDADTRDRWVVAAAESTLDRLAVFRLAQRSSLRGEALRTALESGGASVSLAAGIPRALDHYGTTPAYVEAIRRLAVDALELIAGDRDEVRRPEIAPDEGGVVDVGPLPATDVTIDSEATEAAGPADESTVEDASADASGAAEVDASGTPDAEVDTPDAEVDASDTADVDTEPEATAGIESDPGSETAGEMASADGTDAEPITESAPESSPTVEDDEVASVGDDSGSATGGSGGGELGDFGDEPEDESDDVPDADVATTDEMYELDDEERAEIESEFGTEFATGSEVDDPGEADIDVPDPATADEPESGDVTADGPDVEAVSVDSTSVDPTSGNSDAAEPETVAVDDDVDLEDAVVEAMTALDDGDGAAEDAVVDEVVDAHGADADAVADAIEDALMSGKCYEPDDGVLKPI